MIKLEHVVLASPEQIEFIIEGMRNPMNSWKKSDTVLPINCRTCAVPKSNDSYETKRATCEMCHTHEGCVGPNDHSLMQKLANAGTDHRKFMRMMPVYVRITAPLYWWKEFDTYKVGTVANSCSTMHKIHEKELTLEDFSCEHLDNFSMNQLESIIWQLNKCREKYLNFSSLNVDTENAKKDIWWQMIQLLPSSYNQTRNVMMNYEVLANIYKSRKNHKLDCWREFCKWIEELPYSELICGNDVLITPNELREKTRLEPIKEYTPQEYAKENPEWVEKIEKKLDEVNSQGYKEEMIGSMNTSKQNESWV